MIPLKVRIYGLDDDTDLKLATGPALLRNESPLTDSRCQSYCIRCKWEQH